MKVVFVILIVIGAVILLSAIAGVICYYKLAVPRYRPLSDEDRRICARIVKDGKGFPWLCQHAVKIGKCPCQPCKKVEGARHALTGDGSGPTQP